MIRQASPVSLSAAPLAADGYGRRTSRAAEVSTAQVGLSSTDQRHRDLAALSRTAYVIAQVAAQRAGLDLEPSPTYLQATWHDDRELPVLAPAHVVDLERPPAAHHTAPGTCAFAN